MKLKLINIVVQNGGEILDHNTDIINFKSEKHYNEFRIKDEAEKRKKYGDNIQIFYTITWKRKLKQIP